MADKAFRLIGPQRGQIDQDREGTKEVRLTGKRNLCI